MPAFTVITTQALLATKLVWENKLCPCTHGLAANVCGGTCPHQRAARGTGPLHCRNNASLVIPVIVFFLLGLKLEVARD